MVCGGSSRGGKKWTVSAATWKGVSMGFADGLAVVRERKRGVKDDSKYFVLGNYKASVDIY